MKRLLGGLTAAMLLGVFATAQEPAKEAPAAAAAPKPGAPFFEKFDLNKDGKVDWEEYQKVKSGFATFDADHDGAITEADMAKIVERNMRRMRKMMQRRMMRQRHFGGGDMRRGRGMGGGDFGPQSRERQGRGPRGDFGPQGGPGMGPGGRGGFGPPSGQQGWQGRRGPMGPGGQGMPCPRCGQQRGRGMGWGFGAPEGDAPPNAPTPPPPPPGR